MITKKMSVLVALFMFIATFSFAIEKNNIEKEESEASKKVPFAQEIQKARSFYCEGEFDKAEECINKVLAQSMDNEKATELKNKILLLRERESFYKKAFVNDYLIELRRTVKEGNYYEGFMFIKKIEDLSPNENTKSFYNRLVSEKDLVLYTIDNLSDKRKFTNSIDLFVEGKFTKATQLVYDLYKKYPKFVDYVGMCRYYTIRETNEKRIKKLYAKAVKYFKATKLGEARNYAEICYSLEPTNVKLKILIDQINMEII